MLGLGRADILWDGPRYIFSFPAERNRAESVQADPWGTTLETPKQTSASGLVHHEPSIVCDPCENESLGPWHLDCWVFTVSVLLQSDRRCNLGAIFEVDVPRRASMCLNVPQRACGVSWPTSPGLQTATSEEGERTLIPEKGQEGGRRDPEEPEGWLLVTRGWLEGGRTRSPKHLASARACRCLSMPVYAYPAPAHGAPFAAASGKISPTKAPNDGCARGPFGGFKSVLQGGWIWIYSFYWVASAAEPRSAGAKYAQLSRIASSVGCSADALEVSCYGETIVEMLRACCTSRNALLDEIVAFLPRQWQEAQDREGP
jgi:hypothetical protein